MKRGSHLGYVLRNLRDEFQRYGKLSDQLYSDVTTTGAQSEREAGNKATLTPIPDIVKD